MRDKLDKKMTTSQISKAINGKMYSFHGRYSIEVAKQVAKQIVETTGKHAYYTRVFSKKDGISFDVRKEN